MASLDSLLTNSTRLRQYASRDPRVAPEEQLARAGISYGAVQRASSGSTGRPTGGPAPRRGSTSRSGSGLNSLVSRYATAYDKETQQAAKAEAKAIEDATASAGEVITAIETPTGILPAQGPSGAPYLVRKPGSSTTLQDPVSGEELVPDVTSPSGLKSLTAEKANIEADKATLRSRKETAKIYEGVQKDISKEKEAAYKEQIGEQTNQYLRQGRKYYLDRVTGAPIPLQSDEEFEAEQQKKMAKLAEESRAKQLKRKVANLRIDEDTILLERKPPTDAEYKKLKEERDTLLSDFNAQGFAPDDEGMAKLSQVEGGADMVSRFKALQDKVKGAEAAIAEVDDIKRKRLDIERQLANPDEWEMERQSEIESGNEATLDRRIKQDNEIAADLDETIKAESAPIMERDAQLQSELDAADTDLQNALTGDERIAAQRKRDNVLARMSVWEGESAEAKASLNESVKLRDQRINSATAAQETRQTKTIQDRKNAIAEIAKTPFLAPTAAKIQALDEEEAQRIAGIANLPPEEQENAKAIVADDITKKRAAVDQELKYAAQTMDANLRGLYEKYGKSTRSENWLTENDPQNEGLLFNLMQDAKKVGLTEQQVRQAMETSAALDWSNPRKLDETGRAGLFEEVRKLPDGKITVNPRYYLDEEEYKKVVEKADATPEAKANALAIRREVAAPLAARALSELMEDPQMGKWVQENTKGTPLERLEQFNEKLKKGGALGTAYNAFRSGSGSLASSLLGGYAAVTGNETATDAAQYYAQHAQAYGLAQEAAGKGTGTLGRFAGKVVGAAPSLIPAVAIGLASGGLGLGTSTSLITSSLASGVQSMGGTYVDAYEAYKDKGLSDTEARSKALTPAIISGLITTTLTQLGGARGVESIFKASTPEAVKAGLKATLANIATNAGEEALEEFSDQALQGLLASATYTPEKPITQALSEAIEAGLIGMTLGGGIAAVKGTGGNAQAPAEAQTPAPTPVPEVPSAEAAASTEVLPEVQASLENIITNFAPDVATLPPAVKATAKTRGVAKTSQDAARAIIAVAQGQDIATLPSGMLEAVGLARTAKGTIEVKDKKVAPLIELEKGQAVIRDEATEWLEQNGQDLLRAQIGKTETERRAEISTPKSTKAEVTPEPQPEPTPTSEPTPTPPPAQPAAAPTAEVAPKAKKAVKQPAPKKAQLLIGKGMAGPSVRAQFASESDADAFSFAGAQKKLLTGKNLSEAERKRLMQRAQNIFINTKQVTGLSDAELRPILSEYSDAVRALAKAAKPGDSITPPSLQEFIASKTLPPASQAQEEGSAGIVTQAGEGSISPVTKSSVTPTENVSSNVIETQTQDEGTPSSKAASILGVAPNGKILREGFANTSAKELSPAQQKRLTAASKAIVDTLRKAEKIKGVRIVITDDPAVETAAANEDGDILINPRLSALSIAKSAKNVERTPKDLVVHELIHELAAQRLPRNYYRALWLNLPEATQQASLNEYFRGVPVEDRGTISAHQAGAEFFAQIIEARLKGELASQVWESPTLTEQVLKMLREYIAALRDLAGLITDPELRGFVNNAADAVESDVRSALKEAGLEEEFLGAPPPSTLSAPPSPSITPAQDAEYLAAIESGDMEKAQKMVDDAAKAAGYSIGPVYHGTPDSRKLKAIPVFDRTRNVTLVKDPKLADDIQERLNKESKSPNHPTDRYFSILKEVEANQYTERQPVPVFLTENRTVASTYANPRRAFDYQNAEPEIFRFYTKLTNPFEINAKGVGWGKRGGSKTQEEQIQEARSKGHDGMIIRQTKDTYEATEKGPIHNVIVAFSPSQIKSADPVTYDAQGNIIPLSQRFNKESESILYAPRTDAESIAAAAYEPDPATPSPIAPDSDIEAPSDADDQANVRQTLEDVEAYEELRNDTAAMKALQKQILAQGAGEMTPDPKNRALMGLTPETRAAQQAALVAQTQNGIEIQRHADVFARAREAVAADRVAVELSLFEKMANETLFDADDIAMAQQITEKMQREITLNPNDSNLYYRYLALTNYWADNKTNVARSLAIMRDPQQTPLERMRQSIAVVGIPPLKVRMQIRAAWTPKQKSAEVARLEKQIRDTENDAQVKLLEAELQRVNQIQSKDEILASYIAENKRLQAEVLKSMNLSNDDVMLNPEDRYAVRQAMMDSDGVKAAMAKFSTEQKAAVNLALNGYSDVEIGKRTGFKPEEVAKIAENFRQNILKPAIAAEVKSGRTFSSLLQTGLNKIRELLRAPAIDQFGNLVGTGEVNAPNAAAIAAEIDRILDFTMQPARRRNRPNSLVAKVVQLPNGQKVRMFIPFDPDDVRAFYRYAREMSTRDSSAFDKVYEYWINGILSGPQTQVANIAGNALQIAWNYTAQRSAEALLNIAYRDPKAARLGEFPHVFKAFYKSVMPAWNQAKLAWDTEADNTRTEYLNEPLTADFKDSNLDKVGGQRSSIEGKKGRVIRIPGRALRFFDSLFKTAVLHAEASAVAYREGRDLGLKGPALEAHMATRLEQKGNTVWQEAMTVADELLFQSENWATQIADDFVKRRSRVESLEKAKAEAEAKGDAEAVNKIQKQMASAKFVASIMRFLFPFTRTPTNILRVGVRKAGGSAISGLFGVANGFYQMRNGKPFLDTVDAQGNKITGTYNKAAQVKDLSETFLAGMAWATLAGMAEGDDDDDKKMILIVGNRPFGAASAGEKAEVIRKYGGTQVVIFRNPTTGEEIARFNYGRYEPFATAAGVIVDTIREIKQAGKTEGGIDAAKLAGSVGAHLIAQAESKSFLQGLAGIARTVEQVRAGQYEPGPALGKTIISGIVPNLIRQSMRNMDDYQRDFKSAGWLHEAFPTGDFAEPVIGPGGQPVKKGGSPLSRLAFQVPNVPSKKTAEATIQRYNLRNPGNRIERQPLTTAQLFAYGADGKTKIPVTDAKDKRMFTELYERIFERRIREGVAANPTINLPKPPLRAISKLEDINSASLKEARERFLTTKLVQQSLNSAK